MILNTKYETATLAGGCFWCTEAVFKRLKGVISVKSGYSGGKTENPDYQEVTGGTTGHAEAIQIEYNPDVITFSDLLNVFWTIHDPTTLNRQGNDVGTQYRSVIFYHNPKQKSDALNSISTIQKSGTFSEKIITEVVPFENFYNAEDYHQNFYDSNKDYPYCKLIIEPKIQKLMKHYSSTVKKEFTT